MGIKLNKLYITLFILSLLIVHSEAQTCGNNITETGEECDDNNLVNGDGCDENCQF